MVKHNLKISQYLLLCKILSVSDHFGTLCIKGLRFLSHYFERRNADSSTFIRHALKHFVQFVQFKKREKHPKEGCYF